MTNELAIQIENWSPEDSINKLKPLIFKWKNMTIEIMKELYIAREKLSNPGRRTDLVKNYTRLTFTDYCLQIGITRMTALNWLRRFDAVNNRMIDDERLLLPSPKEIIKVMPDEGKRICYFYEGEFPIMETHIIIDSIDKSYGVSVVYFYSFKPLPQGRNYWRIYYGCDNQNTLRKMIEYDFKINFDNRTIRGGEYEPQDHDEYWTNRINERLMEMKSRGWIKA